MRGALLRHSRHDGDAVLVLSLHLKQDGLGMIREIIDVYALMVLRTEQHEIAQVLGERGRANRIAARAVGTVCDNVRDEAELPVLAAGDQVADEFLVAPAVFAVPGSLGPEGDLNFLWYLRFCHDGVSPRCAIMFTFYPQAQPRSSTIHTRTVGFTLEAYGGKADAYPRERGIP